LPRHHPDRGECSEPTSDLDERAQDRFAIEDRRLPILARTHDGDVVPHVVGVGVTHRVVPDAAASALVTFTVLSAVSAATTVAATRPPRWSITLLTGDDREEGRRNGERAKRNASVSARNC